MWKRETEESVSVVGMRKTRPASAGFEDGQGLQAKEWGQMLETGTSTKNADLMTL